MNFEIIIGILLAGILSNNYALLHFLGTGAVIENERSSRKSLIIGLGTTIVMVIAAAITVGECRFPVSFCTIRIGRIPPCSLPTTGLKSA